MKKLIVGLAMVAMAFVFSGCAKETQEQKIQRQMTENIHALTAEERQLAETNAKQFFNRDFPNGKNADGSIATAKGMWLDCRPSDSNANGLVTCHGVMPRISGGFDDKAVRYCGYTPTMVGCSDEDTVAK